MPRSNIVLTFLFNSSTVLSDGFPPTRQSRLRRADGLGNCFRWWIQLRRGPQCTIACCLGRPRQWRVLVSLVDDPTTPPTKDDYLGCERACMNNVQMSVS